MANVSSDFGRITNILEDKLKYHAHLVDTGHWQGEDTKGKPDLKTYELLNESFIWGPLPKTVVRLQEVVKPNLPWAEDHFMERVGGEPLNPGNTYHQWPFYKHSPQNDRFRTEGGKFTHTYMERYWPQLEGGDRLPGIRYDAGNLNDVIKLLIEYPYTRQAFLPVWFPEDTGAVHGGRVPCTLGYHFMRRGNWLQVTYYIRACDWVRHFRDDVYLTVRLLQYVLKTLQSKSRADWIEVEPSVLVFHCTSLHLFAADKVALGWVR